MRYECAKCSRVKVRLDDQKAPRCPKCDGVMTPRKAPRATTIASRAKRPAAETTKVPEA